MAGMTDDRRPRSGRFWLSATRVWLPLSIVVAGVVLIVIGHGSYSNLANTHSLESAAGRLAPAGGADRVDAQLDVPAQHPVQ